MSIHLDQRPDGGFALFMDGDLQFDTADEAVYHEGLALPALCLSGAARPPARVLICGGGDGLALRECLRFPGVEHVTLVDTDPEVVALGRDRFAQLNGRAFDDPRVTVHLADARAFLVDRRDAPTGGYDVILCDFTVPRAPEHAGIFTAEWYRLVRDALAPDGVAALNAVSPQVTPEAFWCLCRTVRAAGLHPLPYRVCIPSFRAQGYGAWGFVLASRRMLTQADLRALRCPVPTRQTDLARLWRGARFSRAERARMARAPIHTDGSGVLLDLLLNPGRRQTAPLVWPAADGPDAPTVGEPFDLRRLLAAVPVLHPYHTREMVETLAEQVAGTAALLDIRRLLAALLERAARLPGDLVRELRRLSDWLRDHAAALDGFRRWGYRLFAALVIVMTVANAIAPDNAFAKGSMGLGHASMSRGFSGGFGGGRGGFGRAGSSATGVRGGFGGGRGGFGESGGGTHSFGASSVHISGGGFRSGYRSRGITDVYGTVYRPRIFIYCGSGYGHTHYYATSSAARVTPAPPPQRQSAVFAADDDLLVLDNGDVVVTLSDTSYLLVTGGTVALFSNSSPDPLVPIYPAPPFLGGVRAQLVDQQAEVRAQIGPRRDWLEWTGWTDSLFPVIAEDRTEVRNLGDLERRLGTAIQRAGGPSAAQAGAAAAANAAPPPPDAVELFTGCFLLSDGRVAFHTPDDRWLATDGATIAPTMTLAGGMPTGGQPCPPLLRTTLRGIMDKLRRDMTADLASDDSDLRDLANEATSLQNDLTQYQSIWAQNGHDTSYEVDYGTDEIGVGDAINRTQADIERNQTDQTTTTADRAKTFADLTRLEAASAQFGAGGAAH